MKDEASLYNEYYIKWVQKDLMQLHGALIMLVFENELVLRRAWHTLPDKKWDYFEESPEEVDTAAWIRASILDLLPRVKKRIEAAAEEVAQ
jgi:hypothetical protein